MVKGRKSSAINPFEVQCMQYAAAHRKTIKPGMCNVLSAIAHFLNFSTLQCYPSFDTIANYGNVNRSTVIRNIHKLVDVGVLSITQEPLSGGGFKNVYKISFIKPVFSVKSGWQKRVRSKKPDTTAFTSNTTKDITSNNNEVVVTNNNTNNNANISDSNSKLEIIGNSSSEKLLNGFKWMTDCKRGERLCAENKPLSNHTIAYSPATEDSEESFCGIEEVKQEVQDRIKANPVEAAIQICHEQGNVIFRKTMESRLRRLGKNYFTAEVIAMYGSIAAEKKMQQTNPAFLAKYSGMQIRHAGKVLLSRMDKTFALLIVSNWFKKDYEEWDFALLWDIAHGIIPIPEYHAAAA